ncbi:MAG: hypothetical protein ACOYL6_04130 [Bacteriovoracaceae bacterium]
MEEKKRNVAQLQKQYSTRITLAKNGQEAYRATDYKNAIKYYNLYLKLLADVNDITVDKLSPKYFDKSTQSSEMFLISQIYWDLAKLYDMSSAQYKRDLIHSLNKYVEFSLNFPFQVVNAESLRRFIRKGKAHNPECFQDTYKQIYITSKMCYFASSAFGFDHPITEQYRHFKLTLLKFPGGEGFVDLYYRYSPSLVNYFDQHLKTKYFFHNLLLKPLLRTLAKFLLPRIIR